MDLQTIQTTLEQSFQTINFKTMEMLSYFTETSSTNYDIVSKTFNSWFTNIHNYPYKKEYDFYVENIVTFLKVNYEMIFCILAFTIIIVYLHFTNKSLTKMDATHEKKLQQILEENKEINDKKLQEILEENKELKNKNLKLSNQVNFYKKLRTGLNGGFCIIRGKSSDRMTRQRMKKLEGQYLGNSKYLVKLKHARYFDCKSVIL